MWLGERSPDPRQLKSLLKPYPAEDMAIWPVDKRAGNVKNKDPSLIEPAAVPIETCAAQTAGGSGRGRRSSPIAT